MNSCKREAEGKGEKKHKRKSGEKADKRAKGVKSREPVHAAST